MSEGSAATRPGDRGTRTMLYLCMEVAGCPTVCRHCWAQGTGYGMMPLSDIEWVLEEAHRFCDGRGVGFDAYPMHEVAAHQDAARLFGLFNSHSGTVKGPGGTMFEPLTTTGVPLAIRDDWQAVLGAAADTGTLNVWTAFHGVGEVHDRQVNRRGAFAETCRGVERARAAGVSVGCNVFLTTASCRSWKGWRPPCRSSGSTPCPLRPRASCLPKDLGATSGCARPFRICFRLPRGSLS